MTIYGYAAMNLTLREQDIRANRGMRKKTFEEKGLPYAGKLAQQNCQDLEKILEWNIENKISFYRITSSIFRWYSQYDIEELPNADKIKNILERIGETAQENRMRLTFHPDHFTKLASPDETVVEKSITELDNHGKILDFMGMERSPYSSINIHIGAHYSDKEATAKRFCQNYRKLSKPAKSRLTVENDDKESLWSVSELIESVHDQIGIPIVYDRLHHKFTGQNLSHKEAVIAAAETWDQRPIIHYSESRQEHGDEDARPQSHSDYVDGLIETYGSDADVMIEAKKKKKAVLRYREKNEDY